MISYDEPEISMPDEYIAPYVNFINHNTLDARCDFDLTDSNECDVYTYLYDFRFFLSHDGNEVRLSKVALPSKNKKFESLDRFNQFVEEFNQTHKSKISFRYEIKKKYFFKKIFIPNFYHLVLNMPLTTDVKSIAKTINIFYSDIFDFYKDQTFDEITPKANFIEEEGDSFINYLQDEILSLELIEDGKLDWLLSGNKDLEN